MTSAIPVQCSTNWAIKPSGSWSVRNIWSFTYSFIFFTIYGYITNSKSDQLPDGLIAQLVEHCIGIAEVMGSNLVQAWIFSGFNFTTAWVVYITAMINHVFKDLVVWKSWHCAHIIIEMIGKIFQLTRTSCTSWVPMFPGRLWRDVWPNPRDPLKFTENVKQRL